MSAYVSLILTVTLGGLAVLVLLALLRAILGPRTADRVMGINMTGTLSLLMLAVVAVLRKESWLLDVCLVYAVLSFLAASVLAILYTAGARKKKKAAPEPAPKPAEAELSEAELSKGKETGND